MKKRSMVTLQLPRVHLFVFLAVMTVLLGVGLGIAQSPTVNLSLPWHPLQQVAKGAADTTSVDASGNNIIDEADNAATVGGINPGDFCRLGDTRAGCASGSTGGGRLSDVYVYRCSASASQVSTTCLCNRPGTGSATLRRTYEIMTSACTRPGCFNDYLVLCVSP